MFSQRIRFVLAALLLEGAWTVAMAQYPPEIDTMPARGFMPNTSLRRERMEDYGL